MKMFMGSSNRNYNCVNDLLPFANDLDEIDSYPGEYHYLLGLAYEKQNNLSLAIDHLRKARAAAVLDSKVIQTKKTKI